MATVSYTVLDLGSGQLHVSSAGHFPPIIAAPVQRAAVAQIAVDPPVGVADVPRRQVTTLPLPSGAVLCLFTDGLVERRDKPVDDGLTQLCQAVTPGPAEDVCISVMHALVGREYPGDDIVLLILRRLPGNRQPRPRQRRVTADHNRALNCVLGCTLVTDPRIKTAAPLLQVVRVRPARRAAAGATRARRARRRAAFICV